MPLLTAGPSRLLGGRAGLAVPVPTYGTELLTNGNMETGNPPTGWSANSGSTLAGAADERTGGAGAQSLQVTRGTDLTAGYRTFTTTVGVWVLASTWIKNVDATSGYIQMAGMVSGGLSAANATTAWAQVFVVDRGSGGSGIYRLGINGATGKICKFDDASVKNITLASMFSTKIIPYTDAIVKAKATVTAGTRAGVVGWLDSAATPANFIIASHDGTNARLTKCVGGTYTDLVNTAATYAAGAYVEIRRTAASNTFKLYYNGSQVGTDQTISDAGIISNTLAGYFNTYAGNTLSDFSAVAA